LIDSFHYAKFSLPIIKAVNIKINKKFYLKQEKASVITVYNITLFTVHIIKNNTLYFKIQNYILNKSKCQLIYCVHPL
jgi:hypothetical protein